MNTVKKNATERKARTSSNRNMANEAKGREKIQTQGIWQKRYCTHKECIAIQKTKQERESSAIADTHMRGTEVDTSRDLYLGKK